MTSASGTDIPPTLADLVSVEDVRRTAEERLSRPIYDFVSGGAGDEQTLRANRADFAALALRPRALATDVSHIQLDTVVLGTPIALPILLAPVGFLKSVHPEAELAAARAAAWVGTCLVVSTASSYSIEQIRDTTDGPLWFQLYVYRDRGLTRSLVERAEEAGYGAVCLTVDTPVLGRRERDIRNRFTLPPEVTFGNLAGVGIEAIGRGSTGSDVAGYIASQWDASLSWADVEWLASTTRLPIVVKGVLCADDARAAAEHGARAVLVSNHGGRQLDGVPSTISSLAEVVTAVPGTEVYLDGGIRRGADVVKALALGARAVLIGRPFVWGLAAGGEPGVTLVLETLRAELENSLALMGIASARAVTSDAVRPWPSAPAGQSVEAQS